MIDPKDRPPASQEPEQLAAVTQRAAPIVGAIILVFGALESVMRSLILGVRMQKASRSNRWPHNTKLSHKAREQLNEWIREVLPASGRQAEGGDFRERFMRVKHVRDNLAHNIEAMWIAHGGNLRILTIFVEQKLREPEGCMARHRATAKSRYPCQSNIRPTAMMNLRPTMTRSARCLSLLMRFTARRDCRHN